MKLTRKSTATLLLIERRTDSSDAEERFLVDAGYAVVRALSGNEAIEIIRRGSPAIDMVIMDTDLVNGPDGLLTARDIVRNHDLPLVFISARAEKDIAERVQSIASYGYIPRSAGMEALAISISMAFRFHEAHRELTAKEKALRESEQRFKDIATSLSSWIWEVDKNRICTYVSDRVTEVMGYSPGEMVGRPSSDFFPPDELLRFNESIRDIWDNRKPIQNMEAWNIHKNGRRICLLVSGLPFYDSTGGFHGYRGVNVDITERKRIEEALRESEHKYRTLVDFSRAGIVEVDISSRFTYVNRAYCDLTGYDEAELIGTSCLNIIPPEERDIFANNFKEALRNPGEHPPFEFRIAARDGGIKWGNAQPSAHVLEGRVVSISAIVQDITDRKKTEEALRESEEKLRIILDLTPDVISIIDSGGRLKYVSKAVEQVHGYTVDEFMKLDPFAFFHPEDAASASENFFNGIVHRDGTGTGTFRFRSKDGSYKWIELIGTNQTGNPAIGGVLSVSRDITDRKMAEQSLREREEIYRSMFEKNRVVKFIIDPETAAYVDVNPAACEYYGYSREEMLSMHLWDINTAPTDFLLTELEKTKNEEYHFNFRHRKKDGSLRDVEVDASPVVIRGRSLIFSTIHDITDRKLAENSLRESEEKYRILVENLNPGVFMSTIDGRLLQVNTAVYRMAGYDSEEEFLGVPASRLYVNVEDRESLLRHIYENGFARDLEMLSRRKDGSTYWISMSAVLLLDDNGNPRALLGIVEDITELKRMIEALRQSEATARGLLNSPVDAIYLLDPGGRMLDANETAAQRWSLTIWELIGKDVFSVMPPSVIDSRREKFSDAISAGAPVRFVDEREGLWTDTNIYPILDANGTVTRLIVWSHDITERKRIEQELEKSAQEKVVLLRELQHRIKNNLNVISSLLGLESLKLPEGRARDIFIDAQSRIHTISSLYERLYQSSGLDSVDMKWYIGDLARTVVETVNTAPGKIRLVTDLAELTLDTRRAILLGLIVNELLTNALKYAYPDSRTGVIRISMLETGGMVSLTVSDDGCGITGDIDPESTDRMGYRLITLLTRQIDGDLHFDGSKGTTARVTFSLGSIGPAESR